MPCYNHAGFIAESVRAILAQTDPDLELIIVNDCSRDNSLSVANELAAADSRVRVIHHTYNQGASRSRNDGLRAAAGHFIGFCDADDIWEPRKLATQIEFLNRHPEIAVVHCDASIIDEAGKFTGKTFAQLYNPPIEASGQILPHLITRNFINIQTVLMRRGCLEQAGYFDGNIKWVEDWWYWVCVADKFRFGYLPEPLARYRVHSQSTNRVQGRGYCINRYKLFRRILRKVRTLNSGQRASLYYEMGSELALLGQRKASSACFRKAAATATLSFSNLRIAAKSLARLLFKKSPAGLQK